MDNKNEINCGNYPSKIYGSKAMLAQGLATVAQSFLLIGLGMELAMPTIVIKDLLQHSESEFSLTLSETSWYGSILFIFHPVGSVLSGFLQDRFGRKRCMIFANIPSILGWITLYFTHSTVLLYTSTILMGLSIGFSEAPILSYVGEITEPRLRGSMSSLASTLSMLGTLFTYSLGLLFDWRTSAIISTLCPITCICLVVLIPESPIWLVSKGKNEKAEKALCWLRGWVKPEEIRTEHLELIRYSKLSGNHGHEVDNTNSGRLFMKTAQLKDPLVYKPLILIMIFFFVSVIVSSMPCRPFLSRIMTEVGIINNQNLLLVIFAALQNIGCVAVVLTVHYMGKRFMTLFSLSMNTLLLLLLGIYIIALKNSYIGPMPCIPIVILCSNSFFGSSIIILPWIMIGEIFPNKIRGIATGTCAGTAYVLIFILTKLYLSVEIFLTLQYTMILFGIIGIFGFVYFYFCLPETENKTLLEIEEYFTN